MYKDREREIEEQVKGIVVEQFGIAQGKVHGDLLVKDLGDSLDVQEFILQLEERFGFTISDTDLERLTTVGDIIRYIQGREGDAGKPALLK